MLRTMTLKASQHKPFIDLKALLVLLMFVVSQAAELSHLFKHHADGDNDRCEICSVAAHFGNAALPDNVEAAAPQLVTFVFYEQEASQLHLSISLAYTSRAPPVAA